MIPKRIFERASPICRSVIHEWDPYGLLKGGAPDDEFDSEIKAIVKQLDRINSPTDAAHLISRVISSAFEPKLFPVEKCGDVGSKLYQRFRDGKIIDT